MGEPDPDDERFTLAQRQAWLDARPAQAEGDLLAREEPLEIRINGVSIAVVMRTPGHDEDLVRGFLLSERIVSGPEHIASLRHCTTVETPEAEDNVMLAQLAPGVVVDLASLRRNLFASSSCGVCGKASIEAVMGGPLPDPPRERARDQLQIAPATLLELPGRLREGQEVFAHTGGLHATGLFTAGGERLVVREDVGRHNALDKAIGAAALAGLEPSETVVMVSGRVSFEIVQKAVSVGVAMIAAVSAPTSLAVELAREAGLTLVGFVRDRRFCVYSGEQRIG